MEPSNPRVYIETSIVSYLRARRSRDVIVAGHQALTQRWWRARGGYALFTSQVVIDEVARGDRVASAKRLRALRGIPRLAVSDTASRLADELVRRGALPRAAAVDALHIAVAAAYELDYLLTWNCRHIANAAMRSTIEATCRALGLAPPIICTPEELPTGADREAPRRNP